MSNLTINHPENQPFIRYPHWIAQAKEFSFGEKGLLNTILSFNGSLSKASLVHFGSDGKRAIDTAWKGLIQKGILVAKSFKSADNRFAWSYTVNLEKVSIVLPQKTVVNYAEIAHKYGVSEEIARAITEEAIAQAIPAASLPNRLEEPIIIVESADHAENLSPISLPTPEIGYKPAFEIQSMPILMPEMGFNPFFELPSMPIPILEMGSKPIIENPIMPILTTELASEPIIETSKMPLFTMERTSNPLLDSTFIEKALPTAHEKRNEFAEDLLNDKKLWDYLQTESPTFEGTPEIIIAFHKRLDMNQLEHPNYEKYAQHFRNWLPDFLKYKDVGNKIKASKQNVVNDGNAHSEKCGHNKEFNILRKKLQNPQGDYITYQVWVLKLTEISENLSPADLIYRNEMDALYKNGQLLKRYQERKAKMELSEGAN